MEVINRYNSFAINFVRLFFGCISVVGAKRWYLDIGWKISSNNLEYIMMPVWLMSVYIYKTTLVHRTNPGKHRLHFHTKTFLTKLFFFLFQKQKTKKKTCNLLLLYVFVLFGLWCKSNNYVNKIWKKKEKRLLSVLVIIRRYVWRVS